MNFQEQIKKSGLSITSVRLAVMNSLHKAPHSEASHIFDLVQKDISTTSIQAVYNNLNTLVSHNLVREIKPMGMSSLYELRVNDNHHHLICTSCKKILDTDCLGAAPCLTPTHNHGFHIKEAEIVFWGTCPTCQHQ